MNNFNNFNNHNDNDYNHYDYYNHNDNNHNDNNHNDYKKPQDKIYIYNESSNDNYGSEEQVFWLVILFFFIIWLSTGFCRFIKLCIYNDNDNDRLINNNDDVNNHNPSNIEKIVITYNNEIYNDKTCPICLDNYIKNDELYKLMCNHYYHKKCIDNWLSNNPSCPLCRINLL